MYKIFSYTKFNNTPINKYPANGRGIRFSKRGIHIESSLKVVTIKGVLHVAGCPICLFIPKIESDHLKGKIDTSGDSCGGENFFIYNDVAVPIHLNFWKCFFHHIKNGPVGSGTLPVKMANAGEK